jgi:solute carrier family 25 (mitochondrial carnitine/acylcarnitine transporter), member 20/29
MYRIYVTLEVMLYLPQQQQQQQEQYYPFTSPPIPPIAMAGNPTPPLQSVSCFHDFSNRTQQRRQQHQQQYTTTTTPSTLATVQSIYSSTLQQLYTHTPCRTICRSPSSSMSRCTVRWDDTSTIPKKRRRWNSLIYFSHSNCSTSATAVAAATTKCTVTRRTQPLQQQQQQSSSSSYCLHHPYYSSSLFTYSFLPDFTEHPKPKPPKRTPPPSPFASGSGEDNNNNSNDNDSTKKIPTASKDVVVVPNVLEQEITFLHDFVAGGVAGSASVMVGHPFDTIKVRLQTSTPSSTTAATSTISTAGSSIRSTIQEFGGVSSLFRGMTAPLGAAAVINAIVFGSYGMSSRWYDQYIVPTTLPSSTMETNASTIERDDVTSTTTTIPTHDPWQKAFICGAFAGFVQSFVICPLEHIKCRLQIQPILVVPKRSPTSVLQSSTSNISTITSTTTTATRAPIPEYYHGPVDAVYSITKKNGIQRLYQGWWSTLLREIPAFGLYFCVYDYLKDVTNTQLVQCWTDDSINPCNSNISDNNKNNNYSSPTKVTSHTWIASAIAGGLSGSLTWAIVYPVDLIKSRIQTAALTTPHSQLRMIHVATNIVQQHGVSHLFRGLNITLLRALPVNGTIFPVYEFTLQQMTRLGY